MAVAKKGKTTRKLSDEFLEAYARAYSKRYGSHADPPGKFDTPKLYRKRDGVVQTTWFRYTYPSELMRVIKDTAGKVQEYYSEIPATKTKSPADRAEVFILNKLEKLYRDGWCMSDTEALETTDESVGKPMLFHKYSEHGNKLHLPVFGQPKKNGVRAIWRPAEGVLVSRGGKEYNITHLCEELKEKTAGVEFDGEICYDDERHLSEVMEGISNNSKELRYYVFDCYMDTDMNYQQRLGSLLKLTIDFAGTSLRVMPTKVLHTREEIDEYWLHHVDTLGMEGVMIKSLTGKYSYNKRVQHVLKYKLELETPCEIVGVVQDPHPDGALVSFNMKLDGIHFKCTPAWSHKDRRDFLKSPIWPAVCIGSSMVVEYRGLSKDKVPIHAVIKEEYQEFITKLVAVVKSLTSIDK